MARKKKQALLKGWALYLRTSNEETQAPERSQESQRRLIVDRLVDGSNLPILIEYADTYTGRSSDRKSYQQLLKDARDGKFSHVAIAFIDRFGRNDVEGIRAFDELTKLGIEVRVATYPTLNASTPDGRMVVGMMFSVARYESDRIGERSREGMYTKLLDGGWPFRAPDGYLNVERKVRDSEASERRKHAKYERWVELDPDRSQIWRYAWDLLLEDRYTLTDICQKLHERGYRRRNGAPFVATTKAGNTVYRVGAVSRIFHNWFYAGWAVIDNNWGTIPPKSLRGKWELLVTTEEFELGLRILEDRDRNRSHKRKHSYLLQGILYWRSGKTEEKLHCSTPNSGRDVGITPYYNVPNSDLYFPCAAIDDQIPEHLRRIQFDRDLVPALQQLYREQLSTFLGGDEKERRAMEAELKNINQEEERTARLYAMGKITEEIWETLWREWNDRRCAIKVELDSLEKDSYVHLQNLEAALTVITKLGILYEGLSQQAQHSLLRHVVKRVVINAEGNVIRLDLRSPFVYFDGLVQGKTKTNGTQAICSSQTRLGVGSGI